MRIVPSSVIAIAAIIAPLSLSSAFVIPQQTTTKKALTSVGSVRNDHALFPKSIVTAKRSLISSPLAASASTTILSEGKTGVTYNEKCDILVLGSGPAARAIASLLSAPGPSKLDVILADSNFDKEWPPNYGVWEDEWQSIVDLYNSFGRTLGPECIDRKWTKTDCYFGGSFDIPTKERFRIDRSYYRVDKNALRDAITTLDEEGDGYRVVRANHISRATSINLYSPSGTLTHDEDGSTIVLKAKDGTETTVRSKLIVDCTGHETKLVLKDDRVKSDPPGFQIAYGALVEVDETDSPDLTHIGPYDKEAMTLFDYRTDHFPVDSVSLRNAERAPTFMYAMPLENNRIFFEETSLVARPAISFQECKDRYLTRMEHLGIKISKVEEEEFCYIPMGGPLPAKDQRIIGFGGAAAMVHPSTGYHLCRAMMGAGAVAKVIRSELKNGENVNLDKAAAEAYHAIWSPSNIRQRNFAVYGGEFLMKQNVEGLRGFFDGFFRLPLELWGGFLAGWPGLPNNVNHETWNARLWFGLSFVSKLPLKVAVDMFTSIVAYSITNFPDLVQSVTPLMGEPEDYIHVEKPELMGDVAAKAEAKRMIAESRVTEDVPVAFFEDGLSGADGDYYGDEEKEEENVEGKKDEEKASIGSS
mmetsp:Transcript_11469/g.15914  ORF Transcript_11469/g.15914 Transcript_11469/m.15914 type:complete len:643 (-) Transcript_11469:121-2049(-)|eukprot:CAMPEP_0185738240 /NCGR_PEP_ID=MMETSP1171-20130828/32361_1 /TAXON_ID=374046 /ORGANISM="Helicotheca tamensis, Strain CCMP826" /LENGTH=642 /DNA_ID=CAMNT_0028409391 /DNA_START=75 /DNA_END=2003 /DNA_ORIENTATION=+